MTRIGQFLAALIVLLAFFVGFANFWNSARHHGVTSPAPVLRPSVG